MTTRWGLILAVPLALVAGFVAGWALRGDSFEVGAFEAVGTWVGALVSAAAVIVALYLGYESRQKRQERDAAERESRDYTRHLLEGARQAQAARITMTTYQLIESGERKDTDIPFGIWTLSLHVLNQGEGTIHDLVASLAPIDTRAIDSGHFPADLTRAVDYLQAGARWEPEITVPLASDVPLTDDTFQPSLRFADASGQRWHLDHQRRLAKVDD